MIYNHPNWQYISGNISGKKNCPLGDYIWYRSHLLREPETTIDWFWEFWDFGVVKMGYCFGGIEKNPNDVQVVGIINNQPTIFVGGPVFLTHLHRKCVLDSQLMVNRWFGYLGLLELEVLDLCENWVLVGGCPNPNKLTGSKSSNSIFMNGTCFFNLHGIHRKPAVQPNVLDKL